jgi:hypothetical protein
MLLFYYVYINCCHIMFPCPTGHITSYNFSKKFKSYDAYFLYSSFNAYNFKIFSSVSCCFMLFHAVSCCFMLFPTSYDNIFNSYKKTKHLPHASLSSQNQRHQSHPSKLSEMVQLVKFLSKLQQLMTYLSKLLQMKTHLSKLLQLKNHLSKLWQLKTNLSMTLQSNSRHPKTNKKIRTLTVDSMTEPVSLLVTSSRPCIVFTLCLVICVTFYASLRCFTAVCETKT